MLVDFSSIWKVFVLNGPLAVVQGYFYFVIMWRVLRELANQWDS